MKKISLLFRLLFCLLIASDHAYSASFSEKAADFFTDAKSIFIKKDGSINTESGKKAGLGVLILALAKTIPIGISAARKIDTYQKMLNIHQQFVKVFPYFESWKKTKSKVDLIKLINEADREALVHEHQQARYLYKSLQIATKNYNDYWMIFQYIIKKKVSLEKLTDLDASLDFLRIFIKKSELLVTAKLVETMSQDPYFSLETKSVPIKAVVLHPNLSSEQQALFALKQKIEGIAFILTPYKEFLLSKKVSPTRDLLLQKINTLLHTIKKDLDYYQMPLPTNAAAFAPIHTSINPSELPQLTPIFMPQNGTNQQGQNWNMQPTTPPTFFQKIKNMFIRQPAPATPIITQQTPQANTVAMPQLPTQGSITNPTAPQQEATPINTGLINTEVLTPILSEEEQKAKIKRYLTIGLLVGATLGLTGVIVAGVVNK